MLIFCLIPLVSGSLADFNQVLSYLILLVSGSLVSNSLCLINNTKISEVLEILIFRFIFKKTNTISLQFICNVFTFCSCELKLIKLFENYKSNFSVVNFTKLTCNTLKFFFTFLLLPSG